MLKKLREVGVKNGVKKKNFSLNVSPNNSPKNGNKLLMKNLRPQLKTDKIIQNPKQNTSSLNLKNNSNFKNQKIKKSNFTSYTPSTNPEDVVIAPNLRMTISKPKGVKFDQLNDSEKIFYSFKKRTFEKYISSFSAAQQALVLERPYLKGKKITTKHNLTGKITFDKNGHIISMKVIKWAEDDNIQELFNKTLEMIKTLPNPPKDLINEDNQFVIYYQLSIN